MYRPNPRPLAAAAVTLALVLAGCGSSDESSDPDTTSGGPTTTAPAATTTTEDPAEAPLTILVSNDDGYEAAGIDAVVEGLKTLPNVEVIVYAPLVQQSGTGGKSTDGPLEVTDVTLTSGHKARAVAGFPADSIRVAMDEEGVEPDLVITGINLGQNLGPAADHSGTVGAARAAVARGVPALATSSGMSSFDVQAAVPFILDWVTERRAAIAAGDAPVAVENLNSPSCDTGEIRGLVEVEADLDGPIDEALATEQDCESTTPEGDVDTDLEGFNDGFVTLSPLPDEPAEAPEVVPAG